MIRKPVALFLPLFLAVGVASAPAQKFYPDDPVMVDDEELDVAEEPSEIELSDMYDRFGHMFKDWGASPIGSEAANVNSVDEVPDGSWFVNRVGRHPMSIEELSRGPNRGQGPDPSETWIVFQSKSQGLTPGFQIRDEKGERYVIKLDPIEVPELASAAEIIATKIFYALGYHTPENYIVYVDPDQFVIQEGTEVEDRFGDKMLLTQWRFDRSIRLVPRMEDGTMRVTASKYLPGLPIGPFRYYGTRSDDPNDVIPHEDRRELRGLRLFAAWTNHDDTRAQNTQDVWMERDGAHFIRHFLMDFGSTFGSGSVDMQYAHLSFTYTLDFAEMKRNFLGFGFRVPEYRNAKWPDFPEHEAVGRMESELFDPVKWRNDYPNPAFMRMTARDAFWAAKILMKLSPDALEAIVRSGEFSDPSNTDLFLKLLLARQQKSGRFGINAMNPLDEFRVSGSALEFANLSERYGFVAGKARYRVSWSSYDNDSDTTRPLRSTGELLSDTRLPLPANPPPGRFLMAAISTIHDDYPHWSKAVRVYLRRQGAGWNVVGIDRESPEPNAYPMN